MILKAAKGGKKMPSKERSLSSSGFLKDTNENHKIMKKYFKNIRSNGYHTKVASLLNIY